MLKLSALMGFFFFTTSAWAVVQCNTATGVQGQFVGWANKSGCLTEAGGGLKTDDGPDGIPPSPFANTSIAWNIEFVSAGVLRYDYTFTDLGAGSDNLRTLSHMIVGLSDDECGGAVGLGTPAANGCIWNVTGNSTEATKLATINTWDLSDNSNRGPDIDLYGIKLTPGPVVSAPGSLSYSFSFYSNHAPVWQNVFAKDGNYSTPDGNGGIYVYNTGLTAATGSSSLYIAAPDTDGAPSADPFSSPVPEPGFYGLVSIGLVSLYAVAKRRRMQA